MSHNSNASVNYRIDANRSPVILFDNSGASVATFNQLGDAEFFVTAKAAAVTADWDALLAPAADYEPRKPVAAATGRRLAALLGF